MRMICNYLYHVYSFVCFFSTVCENSLGGDILYLAQRFPARKHQMKKNREEEREEEEEEEGKTQNAIFSIVFY